MSESAMGMVPMVRPPIRYSAADMLPPGEKYAKYTPMAVDITSMSAKTVWSSHPRAIFTSSMFADGGRGNLTMGDNAN